MISRKIIPAIISLAIVITVLIIIFNTYTFTRTEKNEYGKYDKYVQEVLTENNEKLLPENISADEIVNYSYEYKTRIMDNGVFSIYLKARYDESDFAKEIERIGNISIRTTKTTDEIQYYWTTGDLKEIEELCDDDIYDGLMHFIEFACIDSVKNTIEYCVVFQIEGLEFTETANSFIKTCLYECNL